MHLQQGLKSQFWYDLVERYAMMLVIGSTILLLSSFFNSLVIAPIDFQQGDVYRIMFLHVPCAAISLMFYALVGAFSAGYLITRVTLFDLFATSFAKVGLLFTALSLITGALWGKPTWGTWWVWDARLTSQLLLFTIYYSYLSGKKIIKPLERSRLFMSIFAVIGLIDLPIIHYSVQWWQTLHQAPSIFKFAKPSIANEMLWVLIYAFVSFFTFALSLFFLTLRNELVQYCQHKRWLQECMKSISLS